MRIALVDSYCHVAGGAEAYLRALVPALIERGHELAFLHTDPLPRGESPIWGESALPVWRFSEGEPDRALAALGDWQPNVVYVHSQRSLALDEHLLSKFPVALFAHNYYGTCATGSKTHSFPVAQPCSRTFGVGCLVSYYPRRCGGINPVTAVTMYVRQRSRFRNLGRYRALLVASRHMQTEYLRHGVAPHRLHHAPLPLTTSRPCASTPDLRAVRGRVLMVARLTRDKGGEHLLRAIPLAEGRLGRTLEVTIAGDGPERTRLQSLAKSLGVRADFPGWIDERMRNALMSKADVLAVPSVWPEPFGLVGIEAAALGLPAVAYDSGGVRDWLEPGRTGEVAPSDPPTPAGLADALFRVLSRDSHHSDLSTRAQEKSREFQMDRHLGQLDSIFQGLASSGESAR